MVISTHTVDTERSTIAPLIQRLLTQTINSPIKLHLVVLFHESPHMVGSARQIIQRIFCDIWSTQDALRELADDGILGVTESAGEPVYSYQPRTEHRVAIARLIERFDDPFARDQIHGLLREVTGVAYRRDLARQGRSDGRRLSASLYDSISSIASY